MSRVYRRAGPVRRWLRRVFGRPASRRTRVYGADSGVRVGTAFSNGVAQAEANQLSQLGVMPFTDPPRPPARVRSLGPMRANWSGTVPPVLRPQDTAVFTGNCDIDMYSGWCNTHQGLEG